MPISEASCQVPQGMWSRCTVTNSSKAKPMLAQCESNGPERMIIVPTIFPESQSIDFTLTYSD
jgi:hypothetical protein